MHHQMGNLFPILRMRHGDVTMRQVEAAIRNDLISYLA
jgi:hypothetical protein